MNQVPVCRVCLINCSDLCMSLYELYRGSSISKLILSFVDVKIAEGDGYPDQICKQCLVDLDTTLNFREKCENSNSVLINGSYSINALTDLKKEKIEPHHCENESVDDEENESIQFKNSDTVLINGSFNTNPLTDLKKENIEPHHSENESVDDEENESIQFEDSIDYEDNISNVNIKIKQEQVTQPLIKKSAEVQCHDCGNIFKSKCKLRVHWKKTHLLESQTCQLCKREFKSFSAFKNHIKKGERKPCIDPKFATVEGIGRNRIFNCTKCHYTTKSIQGLRIHQVVHTGEKRHKCKICTQAFSQWSSLHGHYEIVHKEYRKETTCFYCGKFIQGRYKIYSHLKRHENTKFQCDICKKFIKDRSGMISHLRRHSGVKSYTCDECGAMFTTSSGLANHRSRLHREAPPREKKWFTCDLCGYQTRTKFNLKKHTQKHSDSNFACGDCGQFFDDSLKLQKHMKRHIGEKTYACPLCDAKFYHRNGCRQHLNKKHDPQLAKQFKRLKAVKSH